MMGAAGTVAFRCCIAYLQFLEPAEQVVTNGELAGVGVNALVEFGKDFT